MPNTSLRRRSVTVSLCAALALLGAGCGGGDVLGQGDNAPGSPNPPPPPPTGPFAIALTDDNRLLRFSVRSPGNVLGNVAITGLQTGETIRGIDFRPSAGFDAGTRRLYALGSSSRVYTINETTGAATAVAGPFTPELSTPEGGMDFNPVPDAIRAVSESDQNLRISPNTGAVLGTDGTLAFAAGDVNAGLDPRVVAAAYTNSAPGTVTSTTLYVIDSGRDILATQNPPNAGTLNSVGQLGVDSSDFAGFDILAANGTAYAALNPNGTGTSRLYTVNLNTGAATLVGAIGVGALVRGLAVVP